MIIMVVHVLNVSLLLVADSGQQKVCSKLKASSQLKSSKVKAFSQLKNQKPLCN